jgi:hypothetical protein
VANPGGLPHDTIGPTDDALSTYRINTGRVVFRPFTAGSVEEACEYVRRNQNPHYASPRWLQVLKNSTYVWVR